jgi:hypothetical protein
MFIEYSSEESGGGGSKFPGRSSLGRRAGLAEQRIPMLIDDGELQGFLPVQRGEFLPFVGQVVFMEDGLDGALGDASLTIDALLGMDVQNLRPFLALQRQVAPD